MRIKRNILIVAAFAAAAITISSCSQDDTIVERQTDGAIGFAPLLKGAANTQTRMVADGKLYSGTNTEAWASCKMPPSFDVWAYTTKAGGTTDLYMGTQADGIKIKRAESYTATDKGWSGKIADSYYWGYDKQGEVTYWPAEELRFYAIAPAQEDVNSGKHVDADATVTSIITGWNFQNRLAYFTCDITNNNMEDILIGHKDQTATVGTPGTYSVNMDFHHALAKVTFKGKLDDNVNRNLRVEVKTIEICNLNSQGTCFINPASATASYNDPAGIIQWGSLSGTTFTPNTSTTNSVTTLRTYALDGSKKIGADPTDATATSVTESSVTYNTTVDFGTIMAIPQYIFGWDISGATPTAATAEGQTQTYIHIVYDIVKQNGVTILAANTDAYVPVPSGLLEAGKAYTYVLNFGLGNAVSGSSLGAPITFTVNSVTDWSDQTATNINLAN